MNKALNNAFEQFIFYQKEGSFVAKMIDINLPKELHFDPNEHIYSVDGKILPSVSQIVKLDDGVEGYDSVPKGVLERAAKRGTMVHNAIQEYIESGCQMDPWHDDKSTHDYLMAFNEFTKLGAMKPIHSEVRMYHPSYMYAGTVDIVGTVFGRPAIVDIKTTSKFLERNCELQLAGYGILIETLSDSDRIFDRFILHLDRNSGPRLYPMHDTESHDRDFLALLDKFWAEKGHAVP